MGAVAVCNIIGTWMPAPATTASKTKTRTKNIIIITILRRGLARTQIKRRITQISAVLRTGRRDRWGRSKWSKVNTAAHLRNRCIRITVGAGGWAIVVRHISRLSDQMSEALRPKIAVSWPPSKRTIVIDQRVKVTPNRIKRSLNVPTGTQMSNKENRTRPSTDTPPSSNKKLIREKNSNIPGSKLLEVHIIWRKYLTRRRRWIKSRMATRLRTRWKTW